MENQNFHLPFVLLYSVFQKEQTGFCSSFINHYKNEFPT